MKTAVFRKERFNAAHRIYNKSWSDEKNYKVFGLCSNPNYHGHNYEVIIKVTGEVNRDTGYVIDLKHLRDIVRDEVIEKFDHRNFNLDVAEFKDLIPTAENICRVIWELLRAKLDKELELKITLYETERNFVEYPAD